MNQITTGLLATPQLTPRPLIIGPILKKRQKSLKTLTSNEPKVTFQFDKNENSLEFLTQFEQSFIPKIATLQYLDKFNTSIGKVVKTDSGQIFYLDLKYDHRPGAIPEINMQLESTNVQLESWNMWCDAGVTIKDTIYELELMSFEFLLGNIGFMTEYSSNNVESIDCSNQITPQILKLSNRMFDRSMKSANFILLHKRFELLMKENGRTKFIFHSFDDFEDDAILGYRVDNGGNVIDCGFIFATNSNPAVIQHNSISMALSLQLPRHDYFIRLKLENYD